MSLPSPAGDPVGSALAGAAVGFVAAHEHACDDLAGLGPVGAVRAVVLAGGARTGLVCEALAAALSEASPVPVLAAGNQRLAGHVGQGTLLVACGLGEPERRSAVELAAAAAGRGADALVVGPGGSVERGGVAAAGGAAGSGASGAGGTGSAGGGLGAVATGPLLEVLPAVVAVSARAGLLDAGAAVASGMAGALAEVAGALGERAGAAHEVLARRIGRTIPLFEGASGIGAAAARSWRRSWNLLAKAPAIAAAEPGASFAEVAGFGQHGDVTRQLLTLVSLRAPSDSTEDRARSALLSELAGEALAATLEVAVTGEGRLAALAQLEWLGLATAYARARQEGLDPAPLPASEEVEARLARARSTTSA